MAAMREVVRGRPHFVPSNRKAATIATPPHSTVCCHTRFGYGDSGSFFSSMVPRMGSDLPRTNRTTTITMRGRASRPGL